jgi:hypothetical protein
VRFETFIRTYLAVRYKKMKEYIILVVWEMKPFQKSSKRRLKRSFFIPVESRMPS